MAAVKTVEHILFADECIELIKKKGVVIVGHAPSLTICFRQAEIEPGD